MLTLCARLQLSEGSQHLTITLPRVVVERGVGLETLGECVEDAGVQVGEVVVVEVQVAQVAKREHRVGGDGL